MAWINIRIAACVVSILLCGCLAGCNSTKPIISSAGTIGPGLSTAIPQNHFLVISTLQDVKVDVISENIFIYHILGSATITAQNLNAQLVKTMRATLNRLNYLYVDYAALNNPNPLNTANIQPFTDHSALTPEARQYLSDLIKNHPVDIIVLMTQNGPHSLVYDVKCELSKNNIYYQASIQPHLYLYKIYVINAHTLKIITWITGSANGDLPDTHLCKPMSQYSPQDLNDVNYFVIEQLNKAVADDLSKTLTPKSLL